MPSKSVLIVLTTVTLNMTGVGLVWPILPYLVQELTGSGTSQTAFIYGSIAVLYSVMQFIFAPIMGALSDRFGRKPILLIALAGLGLDNILMALAPTIGWMVFGRALGGVFGATISVANAYMADVTTSKDRASAFGLIGAAFGVGFIVGPLLGGVLGDIDSRLPFYCAAGLSLINIIFGLLFLEESLPQEKRSKRALSKLNPLSSIGWLTSQKIILPLAIALFLANTIQRGLEAIWVLFTAEQYGWGPTQAGLSLAIVGVCFVVVQGFLVKPVVAKYGEYKTILFGFGLSAVVYFGLSINTNGILGYLGIIPHVLGWGIAGPALQALISKQVDDTAQGMTQGALSGINGISAILGPAIATYSFAWFTSAAAPINFPGAYFLAGAFILLIAARIGSKQR